MSDLSTIREGISRITETPERCGLPFFLPRLLVSVEGTEALGDTISSTAFVNGPPIDNEEGDHTWHTSLEKQLSSAAEPAEWVQPTAEQS